MIRRFAHYYKPYIPEFLFDLIAALGVAGCNLVFPIFTRKILNVYLPNREIRVLLIFAGVPGAHDRRQNPGRYAARPLS